jgi:thymidylate kinase
MGESQVGVDPEFYVLLGPDYAGKSAVLSALASSMPDWRYISVDAEFLGAEHAWITGLRRQFFHEVLPGLHTAYSVDFAASLLQTAVLYLRDQVVANSGGPVVVDSYYYKILAKCLLIGVEPPMVDWWRTFPQPRRVVYLDVSPRTAWRRSGGRVNRLEHYGDRPEWAGFEEFQRNLGKVLLEEIAVPVTVIGERSLSRTIREVRKVLANERH